MAGYDKKTGKRLAPYKKKKQAKGINRKILAKRIKSVIYGMSETKAAYKAGAYTSYNSGINAAGDINYLMPSMAQGTNDGDRLGDDVKSLSLKVKGHFISAVNYTSSSQYRIGVRLMILTSKLYNAETGVTANATQILPTLLKKGNTTSGFVGDIADLYADINTDVFTKIFDKVYYIQGAYNLTQTNVGFEDMGGAHKTTKFFQKTIKLRNKKLKYDSVEQSDLKPVNYCPFMVIGYVHLDNSSADVGNTQIAMAYDSYLYYKDF